MVTVGVPQALLYYYYFPFWKSFLEACRAQVILSPPTSKRILERGLELAESDVCLPVKVFLGHVESLISRVDYVLVPRVVKPERRGYSCPKLLGLPDMVRSLLPPSLSLLSPLQDEDRRKETRKDWFEVGKKLGELSSWRLQKAYWKALLAQRKAEKEKRRSNYQSRKELRIGLVGHSYILNDSYVSHFLSKKLKERGVEVFLSEEVKTWQIREALKGLPKPLFWSFEKELVGSALFWVKNKLVDGLILVNSFGCGPDSLSQVLLETEVAKHEETPLLNLVFDEHTSEAGFLTRLEAFLDMLAWRKLNAG